MALAGIGVDMVEIARMDKVITRRPSFVTRIFTEEERAYCEGKARPAQHYAARFAAREAVLKAMGTGFSRGIGPRDVSVTHNEAGRPEAVLTGRALEVAREQGIREVALSLSYTHDIAVANAVAITDDVRPKPAEKPDPTAELRASFKAMRSVLDELERGDLGDDAADISGNVGASSIEQASEDDTSSEVAADTQKVDSTNAFANASKGE